MNKPKYNCIFTQHNTEVDIPKARKHQIALEATPTTTASRCVRRAFLCGTDSATGQSFEHRRQWLEDRILALAQIFAIDVAAFAVMSNHYHLVLHINKMKSLSWTDWEVCERWHQLFKGTAHLKVLGGDALDTAERDAVSAKRWHNGANIYAALVGLCAY